MPPHLSQGMAATSSAMDASHVTNPKEASPNGSECDTLLTVDFGTQSYNFTVNICTYLIF
jgi:hypothetical protein